MTKHKNSSESPPSSSSCARRFAGGALLISLLVILLAGFQLHRSYEAAEQMAAIQTQNLTRVLEGDLVNRLGKSEVVLWAVAEEYRHMLSAGILDHGNLASFMERLRARVPEIDYLFVTDAQGIVRHASPMPLGETVDISDLDYFIHCRDNPEEQIFIAQPVLGRISNQWVLPVAFRLNRLDNTFGGVVYVGIVLEHISQMFDSINAGKQGAIALFDSSPSIIARSPKLDDSGSAISKTPWSPALFSLLQSGQPVATYRAKSAIDHIERTFTVRKVGSYPLYVSVGLARADFLADWRHEALASMVFITLLITILLAAALLASRYWKAREDTLQALRKSEEHLKSANIRLTALWNLSTLAEATLQTTANHVLTSITRMTNSVYGLYGFLNEDESVMAVHAWYGKATEDCDIVEKPIHFPLADAGVWGEALRHREPFILNDYAAFHPAKKGFPPGHVQLTNLLVVPVFVRGKITAVAAVANRSRDYDQEDIAQLTTFLTSVQVIVDSNQAWALLRDSEKALLEKTAQLEALTRDLAKRVEEEITLRTKNERILVQQSKLAAMGEMIGAIAHQWRQPLNTLGIIIQNIRDAHAFGELNKEYLDESVRKSMLQIQHMSKTIDDFRNFFMPDKEIIEFDTMRAVGDVLRLLSAQLASNAISYRLTCHTHEKTFTNEADIISCDAKTVRGYRNEFEHVIMNLVNNAREAIMEKRRVEPPEDPEPGNIAFDFHRSGKGIVLEVSDTGGGIAPEIMERIFEPYFTTKGPAKGTGLGLYMSKVIMEQMKGTLDVKNGKKGAVFVLELPSA